MCVRFPDFHRLDRYIGAELNHHPRLNPVCRVHSKATLPLALPAHFTPEKYFCRQIHTAPIVLEIFDERNALERFMLQFASREKQTEYNEEMGYYTCRIYYDRQDKTELLIRILSYARLLRGPENFLKQVKEQVNRQYGLNIWENSL